MRDDDSAPSRRGTLQLMAAGALAAAAATISEARVQGGPPIKPGNEDVFIVVDVQYDFLPGGTLGVKDGDQVIAPVSI